MKKHLLILSLLVVSAFVGRAQEVKKPQPDSVIKIIPEGRHFLYTVGGKLESPEDIQARLLNYPPSAAEFHLAKNDAIWSFVLLGGTAVSSTAAGFEYANNSKPPIATAAFVNGEPGFTYTYPHNNKTGAYILTGVTVGLLVATIVTFVKASKHGKKSFWLYNLQFQ